MPPLDSLADWLDRSTEVLTALRTSLPAERVEQAPTMSVEALRWRKGLLVCGNGGSAADASHIAGELVGRFLINRRGLKCLTLSENASVLTAWANDMGYETVFSRQVEAYGEAGGVLWAISTSGNSPNIVAAAEQARRQGLGIVGLTGQGGGALAPLCDVLLDVPSAHTPLVQQAHQAIYHYLCARIEDTLADAEGG